MGEGEGRGGEGEEEGRGGEGRGGEGRGGEGEGRGRTTPLARILDPPLHRFVSANVQSTENLKNFSQ